MVLFIVFFAFLLIIFIIFALKTGLIPYLRRQLQEAKKMAALKSKNYHVSGEVKAVNINLFHDNIEFKRGEVFRITSNQPGLTCDIDEDGVLTICSPNAEPLPSNIHTEIVFPKNEEDSTINFINVKLEQGSLYLDDIVARTFDFDINEGNLIIRKSSTTHDTNINVTKGNVTIESGTYQNLNIYVVDGTITCTCQCFGDNKFLVDMGSMTVRMNRPLKQYKIHIEAESGFVGFEGRRGTKFKTEGKPNTLECYIKIGNATLTYDEEDILSRIH